MKTLAQRRRICNRLGEKYYPMEGRRDALLKSTVAQYLHPAARLLDGGCGPYLGLARMMAPRAAVAVGLDREPLRREGMATGALGVLGDLEGLPFRRAAFDVIVMRSVLEHLRDPAAVLADMAGSLRPEGVIVALAPSRWYYASVIGRLVPDRAARPLLRFIFGETVYENYPTYYRANTPSALARLAPAAGLELVQARVCPHPPDYVKFSPFLFRLGVAFDRAAGWLPLARVLQASWLYVLRKR